MKDYKKKFEEAGIPEIVYHYCSVDSLYKIVTSKELWLTNLKSSNDPRELLHGKELIDKVLANMITRETDSNTKTILQKIKKADTQSTTGFKLGDFFSISFTKKSDSLKHWECYGDNMNGVCISLNLWEFGSYFDENIQLPCQLFRLKNSKITYNESEQIELIEKEINYDIEIYQVKNPLLYDDSLCLHIRKLAELHYAPLFKHGSFTMEDEYRVLFDEAGLKGILEGFSNPKIYTKIPAFDNIEIKIYHNNKNKKKYNEIISSLQLSPQEKNYHVFNEQVREYYALNLKKFWNSKLIPEIVLGPKCCQNEEELESFLKCNGLENTTVSFSKYLLR